VLINYGNGHGPPAAVDTIDASLSVACA